jgi:hypothetical protein
MLIYDPVYFDANSRDKLNLRLTRRSGSAGVAGSSFGFIVLFDPSFYLLGCRFGQQCD